MNLFLFWGGWKIYRLYLYVGRSASAAVCFLFPGQSGDEQRFLVEILYFLIFCGVVFELLQLIVKRLNYFNDVDNYFQLALFALTTSFIIGFDNHCWCATTWQWQIGALAVFLSWFNVILVLRYMPHAAVPINMFLSICITFLKLIFLPAVLVLAFGMPFYMIFVCTAASQEVSSCEPCNSQIGPNKPIRIHFGGLILGVNTLSMLALYCYLKLFAEVDNVLTI